MICIWLWEDIFFLHDQDQHAAQIYYRLRIFFLPSQIDSLMKAARSSMLGAGMSNSSFKYSRVAADEDGYIDLQVGHSSFGLLV